jgi:hypothetical protein
MSVSLEDPFVLHGEPVLCVACGDTHADPATATRIGISYVAVECAWTLRYPGMSASEVIEALEARLRRRVHEPGDEPTVEMEPVSDPDPTLEMKPVSNDPAERAEHNQFAQEVLCTVCGGDGELAEPDGPVVCGRCNGTGRVSVSP